MATPGRAVVEMKGLAAFFLALAACLSLLLPGAAANDQNFANNAEVEHINFDQTLKTASQGLPIHRRQLPATKNTVVVLSDIHISINAPTCWYQRQYHENYLLSILNDIVLKKDSIAELVLAGDVFDTWTFPFGVKPPSIGDILAANPLVFGPTGGFAKVLDALNGAVMYMPGNHDIQTTAADVAQIKSAKYSVKFVKGKYNPAGDKRVIISHGHEYCLFNSPDNVGPWAPLPVGHFVSRMIAEKWSRQLPAGKTVADLKDQGNPDDVSFKNIIDKAIKISGAATLATAMLDGLAGYLGLSGSYAVPIKMFDRSTTTLTDVRKIYATLFTRWSSGEGGGNVGSLTATKAALADYKSHYMGWFAQRDAFRKSAELVVLGHTHTAISGIKGSPFQYINSGFLCPAVVDVASKPVSFVTIDLTNLQPALKKVTKVGTSSYTIGPYTNAPTTAVVEGPSMDYSCYAVVDNSQNKNNLSLTSTAIGQGYFNSLPTVIPAFGRASIWLQDFPLVLHGSNAAVLYRGTDGKFVGFNFDCPFATYPNSVSGGTSFEVKSGDSGWYASGKVPTTGHPLFVRYKVVPSVLQQHFSCSKAGQNSFATSAGGLQPLQQAVINNQADLSGIIQANDGARVYSIKLQKVAGTYAYQLAVDAKGPKGAFSGSMYLRFFDQSGDSYLLTVFLSARDVHIVKYNSEAPAIVKIQWSNTLI